jgi:hypothetical protein
VNKTPRFFYAQRHKFKSRVAKGRLCDSTNGATNMVCRGYRPPRTDSGRIGLGYGFPTLVGLRPTSCVFLRLSGSVRLSQPSANQTTRSRPHRLAPTPTNVGSQRVHPQLPRYRAPEARLGRADDWSAKAPRPENTPGRY